MIFSLSTKLTLTDEYDTMYPRSTKELTDNNDPLMPGKMYAVILWPDGICSRPMCDDSIVCPLATATWILLMSLQSCTLVKQFVSRSAMYTPEAPESALADCTGEE